jgi:HK97 gp10 family phage protein
VKIDVAVEVKGLDEIEKRLQALPEKLRRKAIRQALTDGANIIVEQAKAICHKAPEPTHPNAGHLADAINSRITVGERGASARVGIDYKKVKHGHLVEFGTKAHGTGKPRIVYIPGTGFRRVSGKHPGSTKHPFMRPAFDTKGDEAVNRITTDLAKAVEKEA